MNLRKKRTWIVIVLVLAALGCGSYAWAGKDATLTTAPAGSKPLPEKHEKITAPQAAVLGIVEGLTEYLPVSSTGHLILTSKAMGMIEFGDNTGLFGRKIEKAEAVDAFEIIIQFGAILAVFGLYRRRVGQMASGLTGKNPEGLKLLKVLIAATVPALFAGFLLHKHIEENLFAPVPVALALAVGGVAMIVVERHWRSQKDQPRLGIDAIGYQQALMIGFVQCLALWPGTSRSMVTILAGLMVGLDMVAAAEFSFLLALPTLTAATVYKVATSWRAMLDSAGIEVILLGIVISAIVAAITVKLLVRWLTKHGMMPFGVYRIALAGVVYFLLM